MKRIYLVLVIILFVTDGYCQIELKSPNHKLTVKLATEKITSFSVYSGNEEVLTVSHIPEYLFSGMIIHCLPRCPTSCFPDHNPLPGSSAGTPPVGALIHSSRTRDAPPPVRDHTWGLPRDTGHRLLQDN